MTQKQYRLCNMAPHRAAVTLLLSYLCSANSYTPNNFYPAFRGAALFPQRSRSHFYEPKPFAVQPRTESTNRDEESLTQSDFPLLSPKDKRLMGIFRCYGWGPGCSDSSLFAPRQNHPSSSATQMTRPRYEEVSNPSGYKPLSSSGSSPPLQQRTSSGNAKFEPFFTLTSGGSWGPTGKKRNGMRRYSVAEKRLNFLKQILRDMLEDMDEEETDSGSRSMGLGRRAKRSAPSSRTRLFLADVARLQKAFGHSLSTRPNDELSFMNDL